MRRAVQALLPALLLATPVALAAQSSQFGVRGLGLPMRPLSPGSLATGGAFGLFDGESSLNPAAVMSIPTFTSVITMSQSFRSSENPFGSTSGRDARFPQVMVAGPIGGTRLAAAVSVSGYTDRSFALGTQDTIDLRGERVAVFDTLSSTGGLSDLRLALGWAPGANVNLGVALHVIPGSNRIRNSRSFADSAYAGASERSELSYLGFGASAGVMVRVAPGLVLAGMVRTDGHARVERDSTPVARTELPIAVGAGVRWMASDRVNLAAGYLRRNWSAADADIRAQGGIGADDAYEVSGGVEFVRDVRRPAHRPLRVGVHYATLPFPIRPGTQGREFGVSAGTGVRFTGGRGGLDLAVQQLWRSDGNGFTERATVVSLGVSIRP
jgi:hypothetical protein